MGVASGKISNLWNPSIPHAGVGSFVSWILLEPYAIRGRRVKGGWRGRSRDGDQALQLREHMALRERNPSGGPLGAHNRGKLSMC